MNKKLLVLFGSPHKDGSTGKILKFVLQIAAQQGWKVDSVNLYEQHIGYCNGCRMCINNGICVQKDDVQRISRLIKECDMVVLAAPVYWANVPAVVKNIFDRLLGVALEETKTFPKARLSNNQIFFLLTTCNTPMPFSFLCGQSTRAIRSMKAFFKTSGMKYAGKSVWAGQNKQVMPKYMKKKITKILKRYV